MRLPMMARTPVSLLALVVASSVTLVGCAGDSTAPAVRTVPSQAATSSFAPTEASRSLVGFTDGSYSFTFDPSKDQSFDLGPNHLDIPANSVCSLSGSGYGHKHWKNKCQTETGRVTITAVVTDAATDHPRVDFEPAMRFSPKTKVTLSMFVPSASSGNKAWSLLYCGPTQCENESDNDSELDTKVDGQSKVVFRRIRHFSGYVVAEVDVNVNLSGYVVAE